MTKPTEVPSSTARLTIGKLMDRAAEGERIILTINGRQVAALVSLGDLTKLENGHSATKRGGNGK